jgi:hypothetical protein
LDYKLHETKPASEPVPIALTSSPKPRLGTKPGPEHPWRTFTIKPHQPDISILQGMGHFYFAVTGATVGQFKLLEIMQNLWCQMFQSDINQHFLIAIEIF